MTKASLISPKEISTFIDHTYLKPDAKVADITKLCQEAIKFQFKAVCVNGYYVPLVRELLTKSSVLIASTVGFPLGASNTLTKAFEAEQAIQNGADEIDMVMNIGAAKEGTQWQVVYEDIKAVVDAVKNHPVKVIIETALLNKEEIERASTLCVEAGAAFVKTCTGFNGGKAEPDAIRWIQNVTKGQIQIKASGGIKTYKEALVFIQMGVGRIGTSSGPSLLNSSLDKIAQTRNEETY